MTEVEQQRRKVVRLIKAWRLAKDGSGLSIRETEFRLYRAVTELEAAEWLARKRRRAQLKKIPIVFCRICQRRHRNNIDHRRKR